MQVELDDALLESVLQGLLSERQRAVFEDMRARTTSRGYPLSERQRAFAEATGTGERYEAPETYENAVSGGKVPRVSYTRKEVLPAWKDKPLKPPGRA